MVVDGCFARVRLTCTFTCRHDLGTYASMGEEEWPSNHYKLVPLEGANIVCGALRIRNIIHGNSNATNIFTFRNPWYRALGYSNAKLCASREVGVAN
jgi:hypothetical protein